MEERASECLKGAGELRFAAGEFVVEANDADVFFAGALLGFNEPSCAIDADDEAARDFGVKGTAVSRLLNTIVFSISTFPQ